MIHSRCQLSEEARKRGLKMSHFRHGVLQPYVGQVVGETPDGKCWLVVWDGLRHPRPLEKVLIGSEDRNDHAR